MTEHIFRCELTAEQIAYLEKSSRRNDFLEGLAISSERAVVGSRDAIERLRERLTELLARVGFDENYVPTVEGELIEQIIDALYVP